MTMQRKFQGVWIPADVWLDRSLSITEKVMLVEISSLQDEVRGCYASNAHFGEFFDLSNSRVSEIISSLAAKGFIEVEQIREGKRIVERRIRIANVFEKPNTPSENPSNPFGKGDEPPSEKAKGSNTNNNNTKSNTSSGVSAKDDGFETAWKVYPKREGANPKNKAHSSWKARLLDGVTAEEMMSGVARYATYCKATDRTGTSYVMQAVRFFGTERAFENEWTASKATPGKRGAFANDFSQTNYEGTPDDQFADIFK